MCRVFSQAHFVAQLRQIDDGRDLPLEFVTQLYQDVGTGPVLSHVSRPRVVADQKTNREGAKDSKFAMCILS